VHIVCVIWNWNWIEWKVKKFCYVCISDS